MRLGRRGTGEMLVCCYGIYGSELDGTKYRLYGTYVGIECSKE